MMKLKKYPLNFEKTKKFIEKELNDVNILSSQILDLVDFKKGVFFTLLPEKTNCEKLHEFKFSILPQYPEETCIVDNKEAFFNRIPNIKDEVSQLIFREVTQKNLLCIFDDVLRYPTDKHLLYLDYSFFYENEVYYFLDKEVITEKKIVECLNASTAIWHSLCILTKKISVPRSKELTINLMQEMCMSITQIILGAYDGEGYIFWENFPYIQKNA